LRADSFPTAAAKGRGAEQHSGNEPAHDSPSVTAVTGGVADGEG
jgi:hypothetical protein